MNVTLSPADAHLSTVAAALASRRAVIDTASTLSRQPMHRFSTPPVDRENVANRYARRWLRLAADS
jgi:hypothetical protein